MQMNSGVWSWRPPSTHHLGCALDGAQDRHVRAAPAFQSFERRLDLRFGRLLLVAEKRRRRHDPTVDAVAALRNLLLDIGGLQGMRLVRRAEAGKRDDLAVADRRDRGEAGGGPL